MKHSGDLMFRGECGGSSKPRGVSSQAGIWRVGAGEKREGEVECALKSDERMACEVSARQRGRDGSRPHARCLLKVANQLDEYTSQNSRGRTNPDNSRILLEDRSGGFQTVMILGQRLVET